MFFDDDDDDGNLKLFYRVILFATKQKTDPYKKVRKDHYRYCRYMHLFSTQPMYFSIGNIEFFSCFFRMTTEMTKKLLFLLSKKAKRIPHLISRFELHSNITYSRNIEERFSFRFPHLFSMMTLAFLFCLFHYLSNDKR